MRLRLGAATLTIAWIATAACYTPSPASGLPCTTDHQCPEGQECDTRPPVPVCVDQIGDIDGPRADAPPGTPDATPIPCGNGCPSSTPVCDPDTQTCRGCVADAECPSDACLEYSGECADEAATLYIAPGSGGASCTRSAPCGSLGAAVALTSAMRNVIKVTDGSYFGVSATFDLAAGPVVVSGEDRGWDGAILEPNSMGLRVRSLGRVLIEGITIQDAPTDGVNQQGGALTLERVKIHRTGQAGVDSSNGQLALHACWVEDAGANGLFINGDTLEVTKTTLRTNSSGGIRATNSTVTVVDSLFAGNGTGGGDTSAATFENAAAGSRFAFNTVADNETILEPGGVACIGGAVAISSSIFAGNTLPHVDDACGASYSLFTILAPAGTGNVMGFPSFVDAAGGDYHITSSSPARNAAEPGTTEPRDIDDELRPQGTARDMGADEIP